MARLDIDVYVDPSGEIQVKKLQQSTDKLETSTKKASTANKTFNTSLVAVAGSAIALGAALGKITSIGINYNRQIQNATVGLTALNVATSKNTDSLGNALSLQQKYNLAQKESIATIKLLEEANKKTPQTLSQTINVYKALFPSLRATGATTEQLVEVTEKLSIASAAAGVSSESLLAGVDGLATGTVLANSDLGRFLKTIGLSNEALKATNDVVGLINEKLKDFSAIDTYDVALSNLLNTLEQIVGNVIQEEFTALTDNFENLNSWILKNSDDIEEFGKDFIRIFRIVGEAFATAISSINLIWTKFILNVANAADKVLPDLISKQIGLKKVTAEYASELSIAREQTKILIDGLSDLANQIVNDTTAEKRLVEEIEKGSDYFKRHSNAVKENSAQLVANKDNSKELENQKKFENEQLLLQIEGYETLKQAEEDFWSQRINDDKDAQSAIQRSEQAWLQYYTKIGDLEEAWGIRSKEIFDEYAPLIGEEKAKEYSDLLKTEFFDKAQEESEKTYGAIKGNLESSFMDFFDVTSKGFGDLGNLAKSVLQAIIQETIKLAVVRPLVSGIFGASGLGLFANGGVFSGGQEVTAFANGGVVSSPTLFPMANGTGLMGEAGPEAIMPLQRDSSGKLGVKAQGGNTYINIVNESGIPINGRITEELTRPNGDQIKTIMLTLAERDSEIRTAYGV